MYIFIYYLVGLGLLFFLINQCRLYYIQKRSHNPVLYDTLFLSTLFLMLSLLRLTSILYNQELNGDESQVIASAITLLKDPVYGRSVDGTTLGPVNSYCLLLPHLFGLPLDYTEARLTGLLLISLSLLFFYYSLLRLVSPLASRICIIIVTLFFAWTSHTDFLHYSSELPSLLILTACFFITLKIIQSNVYSRKDLLLLGLIGGITPYAKLQVLPIIGALLIVLTVFLFFQLHLKAFSLLIIAALGFLLPTIFVFSVASFYGVVSYFTDFYFVGNIVTYSQIYVDVPLVHQSFFVKLLRFPAFLKSYSDFLIFIFLPFALVSSTAFILKIIDYRQKKFYFTLSWVLILVLSTLISSLWAVIMPGTEFGHHLQLLLFPLGWLIALGLQSIIDRLANKRSYELLVLTTLLVCVTNLILTDNVAHAYGYKLLSRLEKNPDENNTGLAVSTSSKKYWLYEMNPCLFSFPTKSHLTLSPVSQIVEKYAAKSDLMAVWGWNCSYYVETQLAQGVSEAHTQRSIVPNQMQQQYLDRYLHELRYNQPVVFIDAVGKNSGTINKPFQKHEFFPDVARVINEKYSLVKLVDDVRIYIRRDRLPLLN